MKTELSFSHQTPPNKVKEALMSACLATPDILHEPEPEVKTNEYTESKIVYEVEFAIGDFKDHEEIMDDFKSRVWYTARRYGLVMPIQRMMLHHAHETVDANEQRLKQLENSLSKLPQMLPIEENKVNELLDGSEIQYYGKDEKVIKQGDPTGALYIILEGTALMETNTDESGLLTISELNKGDFFGEITLFTGKFSSFSVTAVRDLKVIIIHPNEVLEMVELNPRLAEHLDEMMDARRLKLKEILS